MGDVIQFPGHGEAAIQKALDYFKKTYAKAGLNNSQTDVAMSELEPIVRSFLVRKEFEFNLTGRFNEDQISQIKDAHNMTMGSAIDYFSEKLWLALCNIAGLIGRSTLDS